MKLIQCTLLFAVLTLFAACALIQKAPSSADLAGLRFSPFSLNVADPALQPQAFGRQWVSMHTEYLPPQPSGTMLYVVYAEEGDAPVARHAHVFSVRPNNRNLWRFQPESYPLPGGFALTRVEKGGRQWNSQLVRIDGEKDWFSAMWRENGRDVPEFWLSRRFSRTPERSTRIVAEYRETWPECLDLDVRKLASVHESCLKDFWERSEAAFDFTDTDPAERAPLPEHSSLSPPSFPPDMERLAGELRNDDSYLRRWR